MTDQETQIEPGEIVIVEYRVEKPMTLTQVTALARSNSPESFHFQSVQLSTTAGS